MTTIQTFGPFRLDVEADLLFRGTEPLPVGKRAVALLRVLIERPGAPVSKDALIEAAWAGLAVEESNLPVQIAALRRVLGEEPGGDKWIETLPRRGYRFVGPAVAAAARSLQHMPPSQSGVVQPYPQLALPERPSIAVLPFTNMSGDPEQEYFADGITEDIITALSKWRWFFVIARNSSFTYKGRALDVKVVGRELGVRYLLEGSIRRIANRIRLNAQLINAITGAHIWAERFDRDFTDVFVVQDELTQHVAAAIEPAVSRVETEQARRKTPEQMAAWDHFLRGMWHFNRLTEEESDRAIASFRRAVEIDESLADAHAALGRTLLSRMMYGPLTERDARMPHLVAAARRALSLDGDNVTAHHVLSIAFSHSNDPDAGWQFANRAIELNGNFAMGYLSLAVASLYRGRPEDALSAIDRALRLNPSDPHTFTWRSTRASALYLLGRYPEAIESARQSLALNWYHTAMRVLAASYARLGMIEDARSAVRELLASERADKTIAAVIRPYVRDADRESWAQGLRAAGMPET
jgi:adenylate cyclase